MSPALTLTLMPYLGPAVYTAGLLAWAGLAPPHPTASRGERFAAALLCTVAVWLLSFAILNVWFPA